MQNVGFLMTRLIWFQQIWYIMFFYQKYVHLGGNTFIHCNRIHVTIVHIHGNIFVSNSPSCHNDAIGIKHGNNLKLADKQAAVD